LGWLDKVVDSLRVHGVDNGSIDGGDSVVNSIIHGLIFWINSVSESIDDWGGRIDAGGNSSDSIDDWCSVLVSPVSSGTSILSNNLGSIVHGISSGVGSLRDSVLSIMEIISEPAELLEFSKVANSLGVEGIG